MSFKECSNAGRQSILRNDMIKTLVLEDDDFWLVYFKKTVKSNRFEFFYAKNLETAIKMTSNDFQLILLDLYLPDSQGVETINKIKEIFPKIPVIVISSLDEGILTEMGIRDYLIKGEYTEESLVEAAELAICQKTN